MIFWLQTTASIGFRSVFIPRYPRLDFSFWTIFRGVDLVHYWLCYPRVFICVFLRPSAATLFQFDSESYSKGKSPSYTNLVRFDLAKPFRAVRNPPTQDHNRDGRNQAPCQRKRKVGDQAKNDDSIQKTFRCISLL